MPHEGCRKWYATWGGLCITTLVQFIGEIIFDQTIFTTQFNSRL